MLGDVFHSVTQLPPLWGVLSSLAPLLAGHVERIGFLGQGQVDAGWLLLVVRAFAAVLSAWSAALFATGRLKS
ncbi:hypothetical protein [Streptomyces sp. NPDC054794]